MSTTHQVTHYHKRAHHTATALGWFSVGLGLAELLMPGPLARFLGIPAHGGLIRACGVREIATGIGLLASRNPRPWMVARVAGDAADLALLAWAARDGARPNNALLAAGAVAGVTALDLYCATELQREKRPVTEWDYSDRSGFPDVAESMRGVVPPELSTARAQPNGFAMPLSETRH